MTEATERQASPRIPDAEGGMDQAPLVYALVHALDRAITGTMVFRAPEGDSHTVTFFEGAPVRVEPGVESDRIGDDLVAMDHLSEAALAEGLVTAQSSRKRLGEILVQATAVDPSALTHALTLQTARRLALLANLPAESTFSLYFSARAEPEPHAPWAPLDTLLAAIRAWKDRSRLHGTLRWLADKRLRLSPAEAGLDAVMLTSRERDAVALMRHESPSLKDLYGMVGKGLSSLLYMLAVTRQFEFSAQKGAPLGRRKESDLIRDVVQIAVPIAPVIMPASEPPDAGPPQNLGSVPPPRVPAMMEPEAAVPAPEPAPAPSPPRASAVPSIAAAAPARRKVSIPAEPEDRGPAQARAGVAVPPSIPRPAPVPDVARSSSPDVARSSSPVHAGPVRVSPAQATEAGREAASAPSPAPAEEPSPSPDATPGKRLPPRPSLSPPKFVDQGRPPGRIQAQPSRLAGEQMSAEFRRAEDACKHHDYETADRILKERCTEEDTSEPDFQALSAWVKANLVKTSVTAAIDDLTFLLMAHTACESGRYYRGLLLHRVGKDKAALRDFVTIVKENPNHAAALSEIKLLRDAAKNA